MQITFCSCCPNFACYAMFVFLQSVRHAIQSSPRLRLLLALRDFDKIGRNVFFCFLFFCPDSTKRNNRGLEGGIPQAIVDGFPRK